MGERTLTVRVIGDDRDLQRMFDRQGRQVQTFQTQFLGMGTALKGALGAAGIAVGVGSALAVVRESVNEASALNEEIAKSEQIFGDSSAAIQKWSEDTAGAIGVSQREALAATGVFGNLFAAVGVGQQEAADMSRAFVTLAADLASFNNASPEDVLLAIRSGLVGEAEPLRRYGVLLSEARVQQVALEQSGKENVKQLTNQEKALARYQIIMEDTVLAQGDVARTSDSLANQQRQLAAQVADLEAALGQVLIPTLTNVVTTLNDALGAAEDFAGALQAIKDLAPIDIPIDVPVSVVLDIRGTEGARDILGRLGEELQKGVESALSGGAQTFKNLEGLFTGESRPGFQFAPAPVDTERGESPTKKIVEDAEDRADETEADAKRLEQIQARQRRAFDAFVKGMGLKLDRAQLTDTLDDDIAALEELEAAIERQIQREGRTFELVDELTQTRLQLSSLRETRAAEATQRAREAYEGIIDSLNLELEQALRTASFEDDLAALADLEQAIRKRISVEGRTTELLRELDRVQAQRAETLRNQRERQRELRQEQQFRDLGLTAEGQEPTPGPGALLRRANTLEDQIKGTVLDTAATRARLDKIQSVLTRDFDKLGKNVREAIEGMLDEISGALEGDKAELAPDTPGAKRGIEKLIEGLGLSPEQVKELRQRFAGLDAGVPGLTAPVLRTGDAAAGFGGGAGAALIDLHVTVELDGQQLEATVTRKQEKKRGRNAGSRRGVRSGRM